jgi:hypothetical protein
LAGVQNISREAAKKNKEIRFSIAVTTFHLQPLGTLWRYVLIIFFLFASLRLPARQALRTGFARNELHALAKPATLKR